jgi:hypothetical protein
VNPWVKRNCFGKVSGEILRITGREIFAGDSVDIPEKIIMI